MFKKALLKTKYIIKAKKSHKNNIKYQFKKKSLKA